MFNIIRDFPTPTPIYRANVATREEARRILQDACGKLVRIPGGWARATHATSERYLIVPV